MGSPSPHKQGLIEARGKLCHDIVDLDDDNLSDDDEQIMEIEDNESVLKELIDFSQNKSKRMRTGIEYSKMKEISGEAFKRPKVWSSTRMVVYEFEMVERFLENALYLDIPSKFLIQNCKKGTEQKKKRSGTSKCKKKTF